MLIQGDVREVLKGLEEKSVQCVVTSPPYWGLRDYGVEGQIGLEQTPDAYVAALVEVFREVRRVLKDDGVVWLNLGDSYATQGGSGRQGATGQRADRTFTAEGSSAKGVPEGLKPKDLVGIPWMVAFALRADGWYLRSDIIWAKPNPMPESVKDRPTRAHEYVFLLTKNARYFYDADAIRTPYQPSSVPRTKRGRAADHKWAEGPGDQTIANDLSQACSNPKGANIRSVWTITPQPYRGAHFATFPEALAERCVKAGSRAGDVVLDPFAGSGTVGVVCQREGREFVGIDLNPAYLQLAEARLAGTHTPPIPDKQSDGGRRYSGFNARWKATTSASSSPSPTDLTSEP